MRFSLVLCVAWASVLSLEVCWCEATPLPFNTAIESSGDQDLDMPVTTPSASPSYSHMAPLHTTPWVLSHSPAHPTDSPDVEHFLLVQMREFLQENMVLVLLVSSLMVSGIFLVCCASAMSRQRKFAAYYPSSFPATCYVDQRDKAGGEPAFRQVPNKPADALATEPCGSAHQLQQEILTAARKLRTPTKTPTGGWGTQSPKHSPPEEQQSQLDTLQSEDTPAERGPVTPTEKRQEVIPREPERQMAPVETEQKVPPTETEQEVTPTETEQEVTPTEIEKDVTLKEAEEEVTPAEREQEMSTTETEQEVSPTETEQDVSPTETKQEVTPTEAEQEVSPKEIEQEVTPTDTEQEVSPTETDQKVPPKEIEQEVTPTETEQEVTPTEIEQEVTSTEEGQEVKEILQETNLPQSVESEEVSGTNKEPGAQQEMRSSPTETQELAASSVKLISGETTAF